MSYKLDSVEHLFTDDNETAVMHRSATVIEKEIYRFLKPETKYRQLIPISNSDGEGALNIVYHMWDQVGMAVVIADDATDIPRADVFGKEFSQRVKSLAISFGYTRQEVRTAALANVALPTEKAAAARTGLRQKENQLAWEGETASGIKGFLDNENIPVLAAANPGSGTTFVVKTADQIIADFTAAVSKVREQSKGIHEADTCIMPIPQYNIISTRPRSTNSDMTVLEYLTKPGNSFGLKTITWLPFELTSRFTNGTEDGMVLYKMDKAVLTLRIPMEFRLYPAQAKGLGFYIPGESRFGGVVVRYPLACLFFTGI